MNLDYKNLIVSAINSSLSLFKSGEIAFLALTSKIEFPFRDRISFVIYNELFKKGYLVTREWINEDGNRMDLVVLKNGVPILIVEITTMFTFDAIYPGKLNKYIKKINNDITKAKHNMSRNCAVYGLLLATHPLKKLSNELNSVNKKYFYEVNSNLDKYGANHILDTAEKRVKEELQYHQMPIVFNVTPEDIAFNVPVSIAYWLIGPFYSQ